MTTHNADATAWLATNYGKRYAALVDGLHTGEIAFDTGGSDDADKNPSKIIADDMALADANSIGSQYRPIQGGDIKDRAHKPVLDIDMKVMAVPSSTPGHFHLYIDKAMNWPQYELLLKTLAVVGILEPGYVGACMTREESWVRVPWVKR